MENKKIIRTTEFIKRQFPEEEANFRFMRMNMKKMGRSLDWYAKRGTRVHKQLEGIFYNKKRRETALEIAIRYILDNKEHLNPLTETKLIVRDIIPGYWLQGTPDLIIGDKLYDYKTISRSRLNGENAKKMFLQLIIYGIMVRKQLVNCDPKHFYIVWINFTKTNEVEFVKLLEYQDELGRKADDFIDSFFRGQNIYNIVKDVKESKINFKIKKEYKINYEI